MSPAIRVFIGAFLVVQVAGCTRPASESPSDPSAAPTTPEQVVAAPGPWSVMEIRTPVLHAQLRNLTTEAADLARRALGQARIVELSSEAGRAAGVRLYQILNSEAHARAVYVVPRLFVQSGLFGGRVDASRDAGGRVTLRLPVALVDGLSASVASGLSSLTLPDSFVVPGQQALVASLTQELGFRPTLAALPGCPQHLVLEASGDRLPARVRLPEGACPRNQIFEIEVTGTREQIQRLIEQDVMRHEVRLNADLDLAPEFIRSIKSFEFDTTRLRERLYAHFVELPHGVGSGEYTLYPADLARQGIEDVLAEILKDSGVPPLDRAEIARLVDDVLGVHFEPEACGEARGESEVPCFRYRAEPVVNEPYLAFASYSSERVPIDAPALDVAAQIQGLANDESRFLVPGENTSDAEPPKRGRRGGLLRPVRDGDLVELDLSGLSTYRKQYPAPILDPVLSHLDNPVCVEWGQQPTQEVPDYSVCLEWNSACARTTDVCVREEDYCISGERECVERGVGICFFCCAHVEFVCKQTGRRCAQTETRCEEWRPTSCKTYGTKRVPVGEAPCVRKENQWTKVWRVSEVPAVLPVVERPTRFDQKALFGGLEVQLTHWEPDMAGRFRQVKTTCPLSAFFPESVTEGERLKVRFRVQNNRDAGCEPFSRWNRKPGREPELTLVNRLTRIAPYACGFYEESWNGRIFYSCPELGQSSFDPIFNHYYPRFQIEGVLRMPGVRFTSVPVQRGEIK